MSTIDWNWFFSSVAQSSAAIVGIFGAFIVTKILANQAAFAEKTFRIHELITLGQKISDTSSRLAFDWYHRNDSADELGRLEKLLKKDSTQSPEGLYEKLRFSPYIQRSEVIETIKKAKDLHEYRLEKESKKRQRELEEASFRGFSGMSTAFDTSILEMPDPSFHMRPALEKEREEIDRMYTEARHHSRVVSDFYAIVAPNPESSPVITAALILILALFFVGVIYPLSFMPLPINWEPEISLAAIPSTIFSLRGALLIVVSALFTVMLMIFFIMNLRMKYSPLMVGSLHKFSDLAEYSQYFANRQSNDSNGKQEES